MESNGEYAELKMLEHLLEILFLGGRTCLLHCLYILSTVIEPHDRSIEQILSAQKSTVHSVLTAITVPAPLNDSPQCERATVPCPSGSGTEERSDVSALLLRWLLREYILSSIRRRIKCIHSSVLTYSAIVIVMDMHATVHRCASLAGTNPGAYSEGSWWLYAPLFVRYALPPHPVDFNILIAVFSGEVLASACTRPQMDLHGTPLPR